MGSFKQKGMKEAIERTLRFGLKSKEVNMEILRNAALQVVAEAVRIVPVRTGRLQSSIDIYEEGSDHILLGAGGRFGTEAPYAGYVENGTSKMKARPYMRPAINAVLPEVQRRFAVRAREEF